ncbi:hypothetical protein SETIT_3G270600v2 [Setaria italica]|uniref:Uncharacterized protein n=1 Tax=Setaria italica TaxID=4555 RepID=A0A368QJB5_SETIT|nr:hypothetical protein SETIT_3G270600v2 [Setaria italica]
MCEGRAAPPPRPRTTDGADHPCRGCSARRSPNGSRPVAPQVAAAAVGARRPSLASTCCGIHIRKPRNHHSETSAMPSREPASPNAKQVDLEEGIERNRFEPSAMDKEGIESNRFGGVLEQRRKQNERTEEDEHVGERRGFLSFLSSLVLNVGAKFTKLAPHGSYLSTTQGAIHCGRS